ncbi:helix-turn-helix domain-containing protein [Rhizobium terrae]|uniref:helix-turn-helix domain-containing protein n=1 Tax=Rhizobium terrae TaxID=2171756 RepID=UPI000E3D5EED|nr:helix-turn-helix domain-containing protein [Rhizobium terrae]
MEFSAQTSDAIAGEDVLPGSDRPPVWKDGFRREMPSCRANSRRGTTDAIKPSYPPVESVRRALEILRILNRLRIGSVGDIHAATRLPKPTIVRMLDTLIADGYVVRDNMCGGYRVTHRVEELHAGYEGIAEVIEASRPFAIDLTNSIKWPVGIGTLDGDAIAVQFWTGAISPWVHVNTLLHNRPNLLTSAMGRAYMAFCGEAERESLFAMIRAKGGGSFGPEQEAQHNALLANVRRNGYALRSPRTEPRRNTTVAVPIRHDGAVLASMTVSFFITAVPRSKIEERIIEPLKETVDRIETVIAFMRRRRSQVNIADGDVMDYPPAF